MQPSRIRIAWIVLVPGLTPALLAYAAAIVRIRSTLAATASEQTTPNPLKSPSVVFGPIESLVYLDSAWAGAAAIWLATGISLVVFLSVVAAVRWPSSASGRALVGLRLMSFVAGFPLAWPWISVVLFELWRI